MKKNLFIIMIAFGATAMISGNNSRSTTPEGIDWIAVDPNDNVFNQSFTNSEDMTLPHIVINNDVEIQTQPDILEERSNADSEEGYVIINTANNNTIANLEELIKEIKSITNMSLSVATGVTFCIGGYYLLNTTKGLGNVANLIKGLGYGATAYGVWKILNTKYCD